MDVLGVVALERRGEKVHRRPVETAAMLASFLFAQLCEPRVEEREKKDGKYEKEKQNSNALHENC